MKFVNTSLLSAVLALLSFQVSAQQFFFSSEKPATCASSDGIVTIVPTRGVAPFSYLWSTGATTVSISGVPKGAYSATMTDATGATVSHTHLLNSQEFDINLADSKPSVSCNPTSGALTVEPAGGVAPFTYTWDNGQTGAAIQGLNAGNYAVTVQDASGCIALGEFAVNTNFNYYPYAQIDSVQQPDCINTTAGELKAFIVNGWYGASSFLWSNGATTETVSGLSSGYYSVTITDGLGCQSAANIDLQKNLVVTGSVVCTGSNSGTAGALLVNATAPVNYSWSNNLNGANLNNLPNGAYAVTATDANGCTSIGLAQVVIPYVNTSDYSSKCYSGNNGIGACWLANDQAISYLWDNNVTESYNNTLSPGPHTVTVTTALGCTVTGSVNIAPPLAPPITITYTASPADCSNGTGGALNINISGGFPPYNFYANGPDGYFTNDIASLLNLQGGTYYLSAGSNGPNYCYGNTSAVLEDISGFNPELVVQQLDCQTGYGAAAIVGVTAPGVQYAWDNGPTTPDVYNLTQGCYSVSVTGSGSCVRYYKFCLYYNDSLQTNNCGSFISGALYNDLGVAGCTGTTGIPFQLIRTQPSGALNFTDESGFYQVNVAQGTFDVEAASYDPADLACPPGGFHTVNAVAGVNYSGLDFHFFNTNPSDHRVKQRALRTAQPGYPFSLRYEVCNDGSSAVNGGLELDYGNFFGSANAVSFAQHPGAFAFASETPGSPDNTTTYTFPGITPGGCELLQVDFLTPTTVPGNTAFLTQASVTPVSGDPTPDNNTAAQFNTVMGAFDPNSVMAYPARNGNPRDGGDILQGVDLTLTYQVFFQNTGTAPADLVIVRDTLDARLTPESIRNISVSHDVKVSLEANNTVLVFKFPNINLPDSTSDYANSIGSIQYDIDVKPGLQVGTEINKQAAIYFDFNSPVITNRNVLKVVNTNSTVSLQDQARLPVFPNPADGYFGFYTGQEGVLSVYSATGALVFSQNVASGLQKVETTNLPAGIYMVRLDAGGTVRNGKVVVGH